jgi:hypothetical protein
MPTAWAAGICCIRLARVHIAHSESLDVASDITAGIAYTSSACCLRYEKARSSICFHIGPKAAWQLDGIHRSGNRTR